MRLSHHPRCPRQALGKTGRREVDEGAQLEWYEPVARVDEVYRQGRALVLA